MLTLLLEWLPADIKVLGYGRVFVPGNARAHTYPANWGYSKNFAGLFVWSFFMLLKTFKNISPTGHWPGTFRIANSQGWGT